MSVFDKIKNALFEEEYVEVEEKPRVKPKKDKIKKEREVKVHEKPIAKKVVLPDKRDEIEEDYEDYKPKDEDFEIVPEKEDREEFNFVDDNEFTEQNYYHEEVTPEPRIVEVVKKEETLETPTTKHEEVEVNSYYSNDDYNKNLYHGGDYTDNLSHEYGTYEKEKKPVFKPSPIISPIYGILDKNYKKEEIMPKREVHLSSYSRERVTVDEVRRKAYGNLTDDLAADINGEEEKKAKVVEEVKEEDNLLVDLSDDEKPTVSEVTVGDAEEYFNDLGLEYNIDYKDSSKERATGRRVTEDYDEEEKKKEEPVTDKKEESVVATDPSTDDNLFDLIDSMYEDEDKE